ncbi:hypothetical protein ABZ330_36385 [Streptomyces sp. NPDC006172]|uniref:hypothetical protein n=1 Tax=Streptomyces sp. NPDC006172 TaxID=3154470 RepID=UPI0034115C0E
MHIDLAAIVVLVLGGVAVYLAYRRPGLGQALAVGAAVITLLLLLLQGQQVGGGCSSPADRQVGWSGMQLP